jgi:hypothetical protein
MVDVLEQNNAALWQPRELCTQILLIRSHRIEGYILGLKWLATAKLKLLSRCQGDHRGGNSSDMGFRNCYTTAVYEDIGSLVSHQLVPPSSFITTIVERGREGRS